MRKKQLAKKILLALLCSTIVGTVTVSGAEKSENQEYYLDEFIVTASRVPTKILETPANVNIITSDEIERKQYADVTEVLKDVPGVTVMEQGAMGGDKHVRLNGETRVVIMIDGRRLNLSRAPGSFSHGASYDLSMLPDVGNIERIEVIKGPASTLYGSDAVGGVINIITKRGQVNKNSFTIISGSWGTEKYKFSNSGKQRSLSWLMNLSKNNQDYYEYKDYKTNENKKMNNSFVESNTASFRVDKELSDEKFFTLNFEHVDSHKGFSHVANRYQNHFKKLTNNWAGTYTYNKNKKDEGYFRIYQNYNDHKQVGSPQYDWNNKELGLEWQAGWMLNDKHRLVGGADWRDIDVEKLPPSGEVKGVHHYSFYIEDQVNLSDKWLFTVGLRNDHHSMYGNKATPRTAFNYKIDNTSNAYISYGEAFKAPELNQVFLENPRYGYISNPELQPETGYTTTIGYNKDFGKKGLLQIYAFTSELQDAIVLTEQDGKKFYDNVAEQSKHGMEINYSLALSDKWNASLGYAYLKITNNTGMGNALQDPYRTIEPNIYKANLSYTADKWNVDVMGRAGSAKSTKYFSDKNYFVLDVVANYKFDNSVKAFAKFNNLTNEAYELMGDSKTIGNYPMPGRNVMVGVEYKF